MKRTTRHKQVTPLCDMMVRFSGGREGGLTSDSLKGINVRATGGQRITQWSSLTAAKDERAVRRNT